MIVYPAVDLRGGRVVQWVGGRPETEAVSLPDPLAVARRWEALGFAALHVVDLDAALGSGGNREVVAALLAAATVPVQVGGGVRSEERVDELLAAGAARVVVGTRAVGDLPWLRRIAATRPGKIVVAADCRAGEVVTHGWVAGSGIAVDRFLGDLGDLPLAGILVTDVDREGRRCGVDGELFGRLVAASGLPLLAAGGIGGNADLDVLRAAGVAGAVVGMALYTGALDVGAALAAAPQEGRR
jgi:phosphoribosylformimino-5-aminoimidazole carboxamide ribotide isomerase